MTRVIAPDSMPAAPAAQPMASSTGPTDDPPSLPDLTVWASELPAGLRQPSLDYLLRLSGTWNPLHRRALMLKRLGELQRYWHWQQAHRPVTHAAQVTLEDLRAYQSEQLAGGVAASTINRLLSHLPNLLRQLAEQGQPVAANLSRYRPLPCPESLPRHLRLSEAHSLDRALLGRLGDPDPITRLENACFAVLAYTGLRAGECLDLTPADVDLAAGRLTVRQGKGRVDRVVYLSPLTGQALSAYLSARALAPTARLFRRPDGSAISSAWLGDHLRTWAAALGVPDVSPHRLRHTLATRLLNAGMDITRIQKLLGHRHVTTTMIYARVLDTTLEVDYRRAMQQIERAAMPLSTTPLPAMHWPTTSSTPAAAPAPTSEVITLDNSI